MYVEFCQIIFPHLMEQSSNLNIIFYVLYLHALQTPSDNVIIFGFNQQTFFKELKRRLVYYIFPGIYHFCYSSSIPNIPDFLVISFPFWEASHSNCFRAGLLAMNRSCFPSFGVHLFLLHFEKVFFLLVEFWVAVLFPPPFSTLKNAIPLVSGPQGFRWKFTIIQIVSHYNM